MPASNCTKPPYAKAEAITMLGSLTPRVFILINERMNVVRAKADRPRGAGLAIPFLGGAYKPGWNAPPKAGMPNVESLVAM